MLPSLVIAFAFVQMHPPDGDSFGASFCDVGDLDGDGRPDLLVGDPLGGPGRALLVSPTTNGLLREHMGPKPGGRFGATLLSPGDVDGDGFRDYLIGAAGGPERSEEREECQVHAYSGASGAPLFKLEAPPDQLLFGYETYLGAAPVMCATGDVDLDGFPDFAIGSKLDDEGGEDAGAVRVYSGRTGGLLREFLGHPGERLGGSLAAAPVVAPSGCMDLVVGSVSDLLNGPACEDSGSVSVFALSTGTLLRRHQLAEPGGFGFAVCVLDDLDGDGCAEYAASQHRYGHSRVILYSGRTGAPLISWKRQGQFRYFGAALAPWREGRGLLASAPLGREPSVFALSGIGDITLIDIRNKAVSVGEVADFNEDGVRDLALGNAEYWLAGSWFSISQLWLHDGRTGEPLHDLDSNLFGGPVGSGSR